MKKISIAILSACLMLSAVSAVSAAPMNEKTGHEKKMHGKMHTKNAKTHNESLHIKSHKAKSIKTKATQMPKSGYGGASEQTE